MFVKWLIIIGGNVNHKLSVVRAESVFGASPTLDIFLDSGMYEFEEISATSSDHSTFDYIDTEFSKHHKSI